MERFNESHRYQPDSQLLGFTDVVDFLQRRWKVIAGSAVLFLCLTIAVTQVVTPIYVGTTELLLETPQQNVLGTEAITGNAILSSAVVESQLAILKSKSLLKRVVQERNLIADPEFGAQEPGYLSVALRYVMSLLPGSGEEKQPRDPETVAVAMLWDAAEVSRVGQSNVIRITVRSAGPNKAVDLANTLADSYLSAQLEARYERARRSSDWLNERKKALQTEVANAEEAVEAFKIKHNLIGTATGSLTEQQMSELSTALIRARAETAAKRSSVEQVKKLAAGSGDVLSNPDIGRSQVIMDLRAKLTAKVSEESEVRSRYGERHPDVIRIKGERRVI